MPGRKRKITLTPAQRDAISQVRTGRVRLIMANGVARWRVEQSEAHSKLVRSLDSLYRRGVIDVHAHNGRAAERCA